MKELVFRTLRADEIDVRPAMVKDGKATVLLYIDSRAVVRILNETVGPTNWEMVFESVNGQVVGKMGIWDEDKGMFVYKSDTGSESNIEAQKGLYSDCYKRCLSRWGVDELYTAPRIVVDDDGYNCSGYKVSLIDYNDKREIVRLQIANRFNNVVFDWDVNSGTKMQNKPVEATERREQPTTLHTSENSVLDGLKAFCGSLKGKADKDQLLKFYNFWEKKTSTWRGSMDYPRLWEKWQTTARNGQ